VLLVATRGRLGLRVAHNDGRHAQPVSWTEPELVP
jgi:hypothetical protein